MQISIYTTPTCPFCHQAKEFLSEKKIEFKEIDVLNDTAAAQEMINKSGQMGVPVIVVGDEIIVGFDRKRLEKTLGLA